MTLRTHRRPPVPRVPVGFAGEDVARANEALCVEFVASFVPGLRLVPVGTVSLAWRVLFNGNRLGSVIAFRHGDGYVPALDGRPLDAESALDRAALAVLNAAQHDARYDGIVPPCQHPRCQLPF